MIPKIIHYCWFGRKEKPELAQRCIASWKKYCPDYELMEWNEDSFDINCNCYVREAYQAGKYAFVTDFVRLYALKTVGGIYMDTDMEVLSPLDMLLQHRAFSGFEDATNISTAIMGSEADHPWICCLLEDYKDRHFLNMDGSMDLTTNVETITRITKEMYALKQGNSLQEVGDNIVLYPQEYFCPKDYITGEIKKTRHTCCIHHFQASWQTEEQIAYHRTYQKLMNITHHARVSDRLAGIYTNMRKEGARSYFLKRLHGGKG